MLQTHTDKRQVLAGALLLAQPAVVSAAQIGNRLRVMIERHLSEHWVQTFLQAEQVARIAALALRRSL